MVKNNLFILFLLYFTNCYTQTRNLVLLEFTDKATIDIPINTTYFDTLSNFNLKFINASKWLNTAIYEYVDVKTIDTLKTLSFIKNIKYDCSSNNQRLQKTQNKFETEQTEHISSTEETNEDSTFYLKQIKQLKGDFLQQNYKGNGIKIAVIDNGFPLANTLNGLQHIYTDNRLLGTYDYYNNDTNVYFSSASSHGTSCFSIIGGQLENFSGSAPKAQFYLFRTEVDSIEGQSEEILLSKALEDAVDLGVKVVSVSLGYNNGFTDGTSNHTYSDLDGKTTLASKAVNIASSKGLLVCVSAGNEGNKTWKYLTTPADADSAFAIGSVDSNGTITTFSSRNLPGNSKIRPNVVALGSGVAFLNIGNSISYSNGTSYSAPIIAGLAACLWQAFPTKTNWEIKTAIEQSANKYSNPDSAYGFGIPDFETAYNILAGIINKNKYTTQKIDVSIYPNPTQDKISIKLKTDDIKQIFILDNLGNIIHQEHYPNNIKNATLLLTHLPPNIYYLNIQTKASNIVKKIIKQ